MALVLIKEDGSGKADANSYASVVDGDAYFDGHLYATPWTAATAGQKAASLVMATRLIDSQYQFGGGKQNDQQALQWPREGCRDPDATKTADGYLRNDTVPRGIVDATCEMARELLITDRTSAPPGEGLKYQNVGADQTGYSKSDTRPIISHVAQAMLTKYGTLVRGKSGAVPLIRA